MWACGEAESSACHETRGKANREFGRTLEWAGKAGVLPGSISKSQPWWDRRCAHGWCATKVGNGQQHKHDNNGASDAAAQDNGAQGPKLVTLTGAHSAINVLDGQALRAIVGTQKKSER